MPSGGQGHVTLRRTIPRRAPRNRAPRFAAGLDPAGGGAAGHRRAATATSAPAGFGLQRHARPCRQAPEEVAADAAADRAAGVLREHQATHRACPPGYAVDEDRGAQGVARGSTAIERRRSAAGRQSARSGLPARRRCDGRTRSSDRRSRWRAPPCRPRPPVRPACRRRRLRTRTCPSARRRSIPMARVGSSPNRRVFHGCRSTTRRRPGACMSSWIIASTSADSTCIGAWSLPWRLQPGAAPGQPLGGRRLRADGWWRSRGTATRTGRRRSARPRRPHAPRATGGADAARAAGNRHPPAPSMHAP